MQKMGNMTSEVGEPEVESWNFGFFEGTALFLPGICDRPSPSINQFLSRRRRSAG